MTQPFTLLGRNQMPDLLSIGAFAQMILNRMRIHARLEDERAREDRRAEQAPDQNDGEEEKSENGAVGDDGINHQNLLRTNEPRGRYATLPRGELGRALAWEERRERWK